MSTTTNFAALVVMYFLVVYLVAVRQHGQKPLPWLFLILVQAASIYYFKNLCLSVAQISLFSQLSATAVDAITCGILVVINLLLILLINFIFCPRESSSPHPAEFEFNADDIPPMQYNAERASTIKWDVSTTVGAAPNITIPETPQTSGSNGDKREAETLNSINELINEGKTEEAIKYLRMVVMFGKDPAFTQKAKQLLEEIQVQEDV